MYNNGDFMEGVYSSLRKRGYHIGTPVNANGETQIPILKSQDFQKVGLLILASDERYILPFGPDYRKTVADFKEAIKEAGGEPKTENLQPRTNLNDVISSMVNPSGLERSFLRGA